MRVVEHGRAGELTGDGGARCQIVDRIPRDPQLDELCQRDGPSLLCCKREAPSERVEQVSHDLLREDQGHPPADAYDHLADSGRVKHPHQRGQRDSCHREGHSFDGGHAARTRPDAHQTMSQKRFAPMAAAHTNHSRRCRAVRMKIR